MWPFKKKESAPALNMDEINKLNNIGIETRKPIDETYNKLSEPLPHEAGPSYEQRQPLQQFSQSTDFQLVSAKLDTIKAMLDVINQRLTTLEKDVEEKKKQKLW